MKAYKKFMIVAVALLAAILLATLCACDPEAEQITPTLPPEGTVDPPEEQDPPVETKDTTLDEFISEHLSAAKTFIEEHLTTPLFAEKTVLGYKFYLKANEQNEFSTLNALYIYKKDEQIRSLEMATINIKSPIDIDKILDNDFSLNAEDLDIRTISIMDFDAKTNLLSAEVVDALYKAVNKGNEKVKFFTEVESTYVGYRNFKLFTMTDQDVNILNFGVRAGETDEDILNSLKDPMNLTNIMTNKYSLEGTFVYGEDYDISKEDFKTEVEPGPGTGGDEHDKDPDEGGEQEKEVTDSEILHAFQANEELSQYLLENSSLAAAVKVDAARFINEYWHIVISADGKSITGFEYEFYYKRSETSMQYELLSIAFSSPLTRESLKNMNFNNKNDLKITRKYHINYDPTIQPDNAELTDAIFDALGVEDTGAERFIIDQSGGMGDPELKEYYHQYKVVEISNNTISEYEIRIIDSKDFISQLENGKYRKISENTVEIEGRKLVADDAEVTDAELIAYLKNKYADQMIENSALSRLLKLNNTSYLSENVSNESWYLTKSLYCVHYLFTYTENANSAYVVLLTLDYGESLSNLDEIKEIDPTFKTDYILVYNPAIQPNNAELTDAIFEALGVEDTGAERIIIDQSGGMGDPELKEYHQYKVVEISNNTISEYEIRIIDSKDFISQLENGKYRKISENTVEIEGRKLVADDAEVSDAELIVALKKNCAYGLLEKALSRIEKNLDIDKMSNQEWYLLNDVQGNVIGANCLFNYTSDETAAYKILSKVLFNKSFQKNELKNETFENVTFERIYTLFYNPSIQPNNAELTDAIFEALGVEDTGAERIIVDKGGASGEYKEFQVVEITESEIKEYVVDIKYAISNEELLQNLDKYGLVRTVSSKTIQIEGRKLVA